MTAGQISQLAQAALEEEAVLTPKPGLVDLHDSGAHTDMDVRLLLTSAGVISPWFGEMYEAGRGWTGEDPKLFPILRELGTEAERAMLRATGGVNTHRGAVFVLGLLSAAAGLESRGGGRLQTCGVLERSKKIVWEPLEKELTELKRYPGRTHGEVLYQREGILGVRGEAMEGFPTLRSVLPLSSAGEGESRAGALKRTLLTLMTLAQDSTVLFRAGREGLVWMRREAERLLKRYPRWDQEAEAEMAAFNAACVQRHISPGGCADLLSAAIFLTGLETE